MVMDCYIRLPVCSALYVRNAQYMRGPSSLHDLVSPHATHDSSSESEVEECECAGKGARI